MRLSFKPFFTLLVLSHLLHANSFGELEISDKEREHGGFGGFTIRTTQINSDDEIMAGGKLAWMVDHTFYLGAAGYTLLSDANATNPDNSQSEYLNFSYGGLLLGNHFSPSSIIHLNAELLFGAGTIYFSDYSVFSGSYDPNKNYNFTHYFYFLAEFGSNLVFNITPHFHIEFGFSYRKTFGIDIVTIKNGAFDGMNYNLSFLFGKF